MYAGLKGPVTWTIPKIDIIGNLIDSKPWVLINLGITIMVVWLGL